MSVAHAGGRSITGAGTVAGTQARRTAALTAAAGDGVGRCAARTQPTSWAASVDLPQRTEHATGSYAQLLPGKPPCRRAFAADGAVYGAFWGISGWCSPPLAARNTSSSGATPRTAPNRRDWLGSKSPGGMSIAPPMCRNRVPGTR
jgi:hypothetical protein